MNNQPTAKLFDFCLIYHFCAIMHLLENRTQSLRDFAFVSVKSQNGQHEAVCVNNRRRELKVQSLLWMDRNDCHILRLSMAFLKAYFGKDSKCHAEQGNQIKWIGITANSVLTSKSSCKVFQLIELFSCNCRNQLISFCFQVLTVTSQNHKVISGLSEHTFVID